MEIQADFAGADDVLGAALSGDILKHRSVSILPSGRIGPIIEILMAKAALGDCMQNVALTMPFADLVQRAMSRSSISGNEYQARYGVFPVSRLVARTPDTSLWTLWCSRAEQAATTVSFPRSLAAGVIGALRELHENVHIHSGRPETGIVAYAASAGQFEVVVADRGDGVLDSLRKNPTYGSLSDAGEAMMLAVSDGNSRFGDNEGRGYGMGQMFRALANHDGELRFRSDDYALLVRGHSPSLSGTIELRHKARLGGLTISVLCPSPGNSLDP